MNEQQEKAKFREAIDHTLTSLEGDPFLYQRVAAHAEKGTDHMKHGKWKMVLVIALAAALGMATVALASGMLGGFVNWKGEFVAEEKTGLLPGPTAAPEMSVDKEAFLLAQELLQSAEELEIVLVTQENQFGGTSSTSNRLEKHPQGYDEFLSLMANVPEIPVPACIPAGYELNECQVIYDCRREGAYVLTSEEALDEGVVVRRYRVAEEDVFVSGYHLSFRRNGDPEDYISVHAKLYAGNPLTDYHIGVNEDQTVAAVDVAGMENALMISSDTHTTLTMRRALPNRVDYRSSDLELEGTIMSYRELQVDVMTRQVDADTLIRMFAEE